MTQGETERSPSSQYPTKLIFDDEILGAEFRVQVSEET